MKKLGIVIPTHCRACWLKEALTHLMPCVQKYSNDVCVYVTDNASDDGAGEVIKPFITDYEGLIDYHYHEKELPYYENFNYGIANIDAEYVFLHGDDDLITPYFLGFILDILRKEKNVDLIHFNYYVNNPKHGYVGNIQNNIDFGNPIKYFSSSKQLIGIYYNYLSFMGSIVFRRENWVKNFNSQVAKEYYGYEWLYVILKGVIDRPAVYIETPLFVQRFSKTNSYSDKMPLFFFVGLYRMFEDLDNNLFKGWVLFAKTKKKWDYYMLICRVCLNRELYKKHYDEMTLYIKGRDRFLLYICVYIFPSFLTKYTIYTIIKVMRRISIVKKYLYFFS